MKKIFLLLLLIGCTATIGQAQQRKWEWTPKYAGDIHAGYGTTSKPNGANKYTGRALLGTLQGASLNDYLQVGIGVDAIMYTHYYKGQGLRFALTTYADFRGYYPVTEKFSPFIDLGLGAYVGLKPSNGAEFYCQFGPGIKYKKWFLSMGLQHIGKGKGSSTFYAATGFNF